LISQGEAGDRRLDQPWSVVGWRFVCRNAARRFGERHTELA
jgi:hypothetical protein